MRSYEAFLLGAITGGVAVWVWGKEITGYLQERTRGVRTQAAERIHAVEESAEQLLDRGGDALRRAEEVLQDTKVHVRETLQKGQDAIRPAPTTRGA
jgi:pyruvoyl-dependent arginine decarboxylase (PvlArgDC)